MAQAQLSEITEAVADCLIGGLAQSALRRQAPRVAIDANNDVTIEIDGERFVIWILPAARFMGSPA